MGAITKKRVFFRLFYLGLYQLILEKYAFKAIIPQPKSVEIELSRHIGRQALGLRYLIAKLQEITSKEYVKLNIPPRVAL